jgi:hypothetical protein
VLAPHSNRVNHFELLSQFAGGDEIKFDEARQFAVASQLCLQQRVTRTSPRLVRLLLSRRQTSLCNGFFREARHGQGGAMPARTRRTGKRKWSPRGRGRGSRTRRCFKALVSSSHGFQGLIGFIGLLSCADLCDDRRDDRLLSLNTHPVASTGGAAEFAGQRSCGGATRRNAPEVAWLFQAKVDPCPGSEVTCTDADSEVRRFVASGIAMTSRETKSRRNSKKKETTKVKRVT